MTTYSPWRTAALVGIAAFGVRLATAVASGGLWAPDLLEYDAIARNMLRGDGFTYFHLNVVYHSFAAPLHSWVTAAAYWLTGSIAPVMVLQCLAGGALATVTVAIAMRLFGHRSASTAAGALVALHPGLIVYSATKAHPLIFDSLFFTLALLQAYRLGERATTLRAVALGLIVGVGALSRTTIAVFLPIAGLWLLVRTRPWPWRTAIRTMAIAGVCAAACIAPWTFRNYLVHHRMVIMLTTDAEAFWRGNNPHATGGSYVDADHLVLNTLPAAEQRALRRAPDEIAQAAWFSERARSFITANPGAFVSLTARKFFYFWWFAPQAGVRYPSAWLFLYMAYYVTACALAAAGAWRLARAPGQLANLLLLGAFLLALAGLQSLYYVEGRHRWAVEPMLLVLSGGGIATLLDRRRRA